MNKTNKQHFLPEEKKAQNNIAKTEETDSTRARYKHHGEHKPIRIHVNGVFYFVKVVAVGGHEIVIRIGCLVESRVVHDFFVGARVLHDRRVDAALDLKYSVLKPRKINLKEVSYQTIGDR